MKKYIKPEINMTELYSIDIIKTSGEGEKPAAKALKTSVNGKEGQNYGSQDVSIYD